MIYVIFFSIFRQFLNLNIPYYIINRRTLAQDSVKTKSMSHHISTPVIFTPDFFSEMAHNDHYNSSLTSSFTSDLHTYSFTDNSKNTNDMAVK